MQIPDHLAKLAETDVCRGLSPQDVEQIAEAGRFHSAPAGTVLMTEGAAAESMLVLLRGQAEVTKADGSGTRHELATLGPGAMLGEVGMLIAAPRTATVTASAAVEYFELEKSRFDALAAGGSPAALKIGLALARSVAARQESMNARLIRLLDEAQRRSASPELDAFGRRLLSHWNY